MGTLVLFQSVPSTPKDCMEYLEKYSEVLADVPFKYVHNEEFGCITMSDEHGSVHLERNGVACLRGSFVNILNLVSKTFHTKYSFID